MVRKIVTLFSAAVFAFFFSFSLSHAATVTSGKMFKTFQNQYKQENYDFKAGSLTLQDAQTFNLTTPITVKKGTDEIQVSQIQAAVAHFKTVRDGIFFKDWKEYAYYAPEQDVVLTEGDVMNNKAIQAYEKQHPTRVSLELGPIVGLLLLIIIIPVLVAFIQSKRGYSSLEFKLKNNLLDPDPKH